MRAYGFGDPAGGRANVTRRVAAGTSSGPAYRLRTAADASWPAQQAYYGRHETVWTRFGDAFRAVGRLIVPVIMLLLSFAAVYLYLDTPATALVGSVDGQWLTVGHLMLPFSFLAVHLTNRRYGPSYAFAQVVLALALGAAFALYAVPMLRDVMPFKFVPDMRMAGAFSGAFFLASFISITVFDGARGPRWWIAPLLGMASAVALFCLIYYPAAYAGIAPWTHQMLLHMELLLAIAVLSLIPYWSLRGIVRPMPGFNGY
ncbi:MAG TPA: hypothetical protein VMF58_04455 [Rhizomicrobium sp.]|nr:hypothetical protein [Rhizomicrobium sp.]